MIKNPLDSLLQYRFLGSILTDFDSSDLGKEQECAAAASGLRIPTPALYYSFILFIPQYLQEFLISRLWLDFLVKLFNLSVLYFLLCKMEPVIVYSVS